MKKIITFFSEMIPFILLLLLILYPSNFILISNTILGKIIAIVITAFYMVQDVLSGTLIGLIFLCFYQTDIVHNICKSEHFDVLPSPMTISEENSPDLTTESFTDYSEQNIEEGIHPYKNENTQLCSVNTRSRIKVQPESETVFKNQHCSKDLEFTYNKQIITHPETVQMLNKDLHFLDGKVCNPCDPTCSFSISTSPAPPVRVFENQDVKERVGKSTKQNSLEEVFAWAQSWMVNKSEPFIGIGGSYTASYF